MSAQIHRERNACYDTLEQTQKGNLDVTHWLVWFLDCLDRAILGTDDMLGQVLNKANIWDRLRDRPLNDRQCATFNRLLDGFENKLTSGKWAKLTKVSTDTDLRDITELVTLGVLHKDEGGGRNTSYSLRTGQERRGRSESRRKPQNHVP